MCAKQVRDRGGSFLRTVCGSYPDHVQPVYRCPRLGQVDGHRHAGRLRRTVAHQPFELRIHRRARLRAQHVDRHPQLVLDRFTIVRPVDPWAECQAVRIDRLAGDRHAGASLHDDHSKTIGQQSSARPVVGFTGLHRRELRCGSWPIVEVRRCQRGGHPRRPAGSDGADQLRPRVRAARRQRRPAGQPVAFSGAHLVVGQLLVERVDMDVVGVDAHAQYGAVVVGACLDTHGQEQQGNRRIDVLPVVFGHQRILSIISPAANAAREGC